MRRPPLDPHERAAQQFDADRRMGWAGIALVAVVLLAIVAGFWAGTFWLVVHYTAGHHP